MNSFYSVNARTTAAILAGLRLLQQTVRERYVPTSGVEDIYTNGGTLKPLSLKEIDALCETLNVAGIPSREKPGREKPVQLTPEQWQEIAACLSGKRHRLAQGDYQPCMEHITKKGAQDCVKKCDAHWMMNIAGIEVAIGPDGADAITRGVAAVQGTKGN